MNNLENKNFFYERFSSYADQIAIIWQDKKINYSHILARIDYWRTQLNGKAEGKVVGLESDFTPETISILFCLIEFNSIIVPFDIKQSKKNLKKIDIAQLDLFIKVNDEINIEIFEIISGFAKNEIYKAVTEKKIPGLVLFTSGSSGEPKGAFHDFSRLLAKFQIKRSALMTINFLLFDHWGGLNTLFHVLSNGGTVLFLQNRNPDYICELIQKYEVELLPTSPTFLNMLILSRAYERFSLSSLKIISYGAEPMPENLLVHLNVLFPAIKFQQTYGLIELGVMRSQSEGNGSLWVKIGGEGYQTRVVDNMLQIKSDSAMIGYLNAASPFTTDGWFMTGDAVEVKDEYFRILGRKSELINVGGEKVFPQEIENVILQIPRAIDVLVFSEKHSFTGNIVCAKVQVNESVDSKEFIKEIKRFCRERLESFKIPVKIIITEEPLYTGRFKKQRV
jgi:long-chain acyl-CoA synthetase